MQLRSIQTGPAIELPLTNSPQTLPFEWRAHIPSKRVFLEVLLEGFPPLKLVAGDPAGLSAKPHVEHAEASIPARAIVEHCLQRSPYTREMSIQALLAVVTAGTASLSDPNPTRR